MKKSTINKANKMVILAVVMTSMKTLKRTRTRTRTMTKRKRRKRKRRLVQQQQKLRWRASNIQKI